jgi:hypothetical protein
MSSANEPGQLYIVAISPQGQELVVASQRSDGPINAGKSPDGVLANLTIDKWMNLPRGGPVLSGGWKVGIRFKMDAVDGLDASDCVIQIPLTFDDGSTRTLNATDLGFTVDIPAATPAGVMLPLGTDYTIPNGLRAKIGGGPVVVSIEDDTL